MTRSTSRSWLALLAATGCGLALVLMSRVTHAIVIDDFSDAVHSAVRDNLHVRGRGSKALKDRPALRGVLGGTRQLTVRVDDPAAASGLVDLWVDRSANRLSYASSEGADGAFELLYDAAGHGLRADFSSEGALSVALEADVSSVPYTVTLTLIDSAGRKASARRTVSRAGAQQVDFLLGGMRIDTRRIASLRLAVDPRAAADIEILRVATVGRHLGRGGR